MSIKLLSALALALVSNIALAETNFPHNNKQLPFGQDLNQVLAHLQESCSSIVLHQEQSLEVPTATSSQSQIDCTDYQALDHSGLSEWIFADNHLDIVWLLSPLEQIEMTKSTLSQQGIEADYSLANMADFYLDRGLGFRYEPTEVLYFSDRLIPYYRSWLENM